MPKAAAAAKAATTPADTQQQIEHRLVPVSTIKPSPDNPRSGITTDNLAELADSIKAQGLIEPVVIRPNDDGDMLAEFVLVVGERRWRATQQAGLPQIPAVIRWDLDRKAALELTIIENFQRADLNPIDEARGFASLQQVAGLTQKQIAERIGASQPVVANRLRLLELPPEVQEELERGNISLAQGLAMLRYRKAPVTDDMMKLVAYEVMDKRLTVKEIERGMPALGLMEQHGLAAFIGHDSQLPHSWTKACLECPFGAMRQVQNLAAYCIKPEHAVELREAWDTQRAAQKQTANQDAIAAAQAVFKGEAVAIPTAKPAETSPDGAQDDDTAAEQVEVAADTVTTPAPDSEPAENVTNLWDKLPQIEMLGYGTYERIGEWNKPEACGPECACYGLARSQTLDYPVPVCFDPKRFSSMKAADTKARNKKKAEALEVRLDEMRALIDAKGQDLGFLNAADLVVLIAHAMRRDYSSEGAMRRAATRRDLAFEVSNYAMASHRLNEQGQQELQTVAELGAEAVLKIMLEGLFELEIKHEMEIGGADAQTGIFAWWKERQAKPEAKAKKAKKETA